MQIIVSITDRLIAEKVHTFAFSGHEFPGNHANKSSETIFLI